MGTLGNERDRKAQGNQCPSCRAPLQIGARFCGVCGFRLDDEKPLEGGRAPVLTPGQMPRAAGTVASSPDDPYIGAVLNNRFHIESKIGEGGFGAVYRGTQKGTGRRVALKLLHPDSTQDENLTERFRREGLVLCNLRDAHTITTYDFDCTPDGTLYIAMELLEGRSLHDVFHREAPLEWRRMFRILGQMCSSLAEAHAHGIVHRDLKPENIYLENRPGNPEFVKILDFGIAKVMQGDVVGGQAAQLTATGQTLGTLEYMSPEQLMGKELDGRSDLYALGVLTYEMITGRLPFPDAKGPAGLITAQLRQVPDPPSAVNPGGSIPPSVDQIVLQMLEKDKKKRYSGVDELRKHVIDLFGSGQWGADAAAHPAGGPAPGPVIHDSHLGMAGSRPPAPNPDPAAQNPLLHGSSPGLHPPAVAQQAGYGGPSPSPGPPSPVPSSHASHPGLMNPHASHLAAQQTDAGGESRVWLWLVIAVIVIGSAVGAALALA